MLLENIRVVTDFQESKNIMRTSGKKSVRLQAGFFIHQDPTFGAADFQNLARNTAFFMKLASELPDVDFLLVPSGTVVYWTFCDGVHWDHVNKYIPGQSTRIQFSEELLREQARRYGILF